MVLPVDGIHNAYFSRKDTPVLFLCVDPTV